MNKVFICTVCGLTREQKVLYDATVRGAQRELDKDPETSPLVTVNRLRKICCTPELLQSCDEMTRTPEAGKLLVLVDLLKRTREKTSDRFVLISNFTSVLDVFERVLLGMRLQFLRLDGSQAANRRQVITCMIDALLCPSPQDDQFTFASKARFPQSGHCRQVQRPSIPLLLLSSFQSGRRLRNQLDWSKPTSSIWSRSSQLKRPLRPHIDTSVRCKYNLSHITICRLEPSHGCASSRSCMAEWAEKALLYLCENTPWVFQFDTLSYFHNTSSEILCCRITWREGVTTTTSQGRIERSDHWWQYGIEAVWFEWAEGGMLFPAFVKLEHCQDLHTSLRRET